MKLTDEQKTKFAPMLRQTWESIGPDADGVLVIRGNSRAADIADIVCDANRPEMYGGMSHEDYEVLLGAYHDQDTKNWLKQVLNY